MSAIVVRSEAEPAAEPVAGGGRLKGVHVKLITALGAVIFLTTAAGCSGGGEITDDDLDGRSFTLSEASGDGVAEQLSDEATLELSFDDGVQFYAGCNRHQSENMSIDDDTLVVESFSATLIGCEEEAQELDGELNEFFSSSPDIELDGSTLTVAGEDATLTFTEDGGSA